MPRLRNYIRYRRISICLLMIIFVSGCAGSSALSSEVGESSTPEQSLGATETAGRDPTEALPAHTPQPPSIPASATLAPTTETPTVTLPVVIESATPTIAQQVLAPNADVEPAIARIRQQFAAINQELEQYRTVERPLVGFSTEGGTLTGYFAGPSLRKMAASYFGESGRADEEYYFWDDRLFFVFRTQYLYDRPFGEVVTTTENRFYFEDDHLIRWIDENQRHVSSDDPDFLEQQAEKLAQSQQLIDILSAPAEEY